MATANKKLNQESSNTIRQIPDHPSYWITSDARVISFKGKFPKFLKAQVNSHGRKQFRLDGKYLHAARLIAMTYHADQCFEGAHADHIDGDKTNDHMSNIQWLSPTDNIRKHYGLPLSKSWRVKSPEGDSYIVTKPSKFAKQHGISQSSFSELLNESIIRSGTNYYTRKSVEGWYVVDG